MSTTDTKVLIVGAGPSGLATTHCLEALGVKTRLVDRTGLVGGSYNHIYPKTKLASPLKFTKLPDFESKNLPEYVTAGEYKEYLCEYAHNFNIVPEKLNVTKIEKYHKFFHVKFEQDETIWAYKLVVICTGMYDNPLSPTVPMENCQIKILHAKDWPGPESFENQRVLIIGGATSAIEITEACGRAKLDVTICSRHPVSFITQKVFGYDLHEFVFLSDYIPSMFVKSDCYRRPTLPGTDLGFSDMRIKGVIKVIENDSIDKIIDKTVYFKKSEKQEVDVIINATGYAFLTPYVCGIEKSTYPTGHPVSNMSGESSTCENLFLMGYPCSFGVWSEFLRGIAKDAVEISAIIKKRLE